MTSNSNNLSTISQIVNRDNLGKFTPIINKNTNFPSRINRNDYEPGIQAYNGFNSKVNDRIKLTNEAAKFLFEIKENEKERLINANEKTDNFLYKRNVDYKIQRSRDRNKSLDMFVQGSHQYLRNANFQKDNYYDIYVK